MAAISLMQKAKARLLIKHVFFATLVMSTEIKEDKTCQTAWTDMTRIGYNPDFIESLDIEVVLFVLAHEVMHIMFKHGLRKQGRNHQRWNIACDFAINLILKKAGFKLWAHCLCDDKYDGMSAEQIYEVREKEREEKIKKGQKCPQQFGQGREGQGTPDNGCDQWEEMDDLREPGNMDPAEQAKIEREIMQKVAQAASMARLAGRMSGDLERLCDAMLNPEVPWTDLFREYMTRIVQDDESWVRRNRRISDYFFPAKHSDAMGEAILIGDTSGSVHGNKDYYERIGGELNGIVLQTRPERVRVIWADDDECSLQEIFEEGDTITLHPKGGGGTDMRKPLQFVEQYNPMVVVLVTDGYTPWPEDTSYPLIVLCTTDAPCPIGQVIRIK